MKHIPEATPSEAELKRAQIAKTQRTLVCLKHSLAEGEEIHAVRPATEEEFEQALARGEIKELTPRLEVIIGH